MGTDRFRFVSPAVFAVLLAALSGGEAAADDDDQVSQESIANALDLAFGVSVVSDYIDGAESLSDGRPSVAAFVEPSYGIFYVGAGFATVRFAEDGDDPDTVPPDEIANLEGRVYFGVRPVLGPVSFDLGFEYKAYDALPDEAESSLHLEAETELIGRLEAELEAEYELREQVWELEAGLTFEAFESVSLFAGIGHEFEEDGVTYWRAGAAYEFNDYFTGTLTYHGAEDGFAKLVAGLALKASVLQLDGAAVADD